MEKNSQNSVYNRLLLVPEGKLISVPDIFSKKARYKNGRSNYYVDPFTHVITYRQRANQAELKITIKHEKGQYHYDGYSSDNLYAVLVHTRLFEQLFGTYRQRHVAVTHELLALPLEDQPWFFGAISSYEAEALLAKSATNRTFLTRNEGSQAWLHWSGGKPDQGNRTLLKHYKLMPDHIALMLTGLNNQGHIKAKETFTLYRLVVQGNLSKVKQFIADNKYTAEQLTQMRLLHEHLELAKTINNDLVKWLIDFGIPASTYLISPNVIQRSMGTALILAGRGSECAFGGIEGLVKTLLQRGAQCTFEAIEELVTYGVSYPLFLKFWNGLPSESYNYPRLLQRLHEHARKYTDAHERSRLILMAWQFGNDDNYFKMLPRELLVYLFDFGIAESDWFLIGKKILSKCNKIAITPYYSVPVLSKVLPFVYRFWYSFSADGLRNLFDWLYTKVGFESLPNAEARTVVKWCIKLWKEKVPSLTKIENYGNGPVLLAYCAKHEEAFELFKLLVDYNPKAVQLPCWDSTAKKTMPIWSFTVAYQNKLAARYVVSLNLCKKELEFFVK